MATNIIFIYCSKTFLVFESLLDYKDTQLMIFSLIPTIAIAYFQYKLQKKSDKEQEIKDKWHEKEQCKKDEWHKKELIYERIKEIYSSLHLSGFLINFNVRNSIGRYSEYKSGAREDTAFYMEINPTYFTANDKYAEFYPGYFQVKLNTISFNNTKVFPISKDSPSVTYFDLKRQWLKFWFKSQDICRGFGIPENPNIHCKMEVNLKDLTLEKDYINVDLSMEFDIVPNGSYDEYGFLKFCANNMKISVL